MGTQIYPSVAVERLRRLHGRLGKRLDPGSFPITGRVFENTGRAAVGEIQMSDSTRSCYSPPTVARMRRRVRRSLRARPTGANPNLDIYSRRFDAGERR